MLFLSGHGPPAVKMVILSEIVFFLFTVFMKCDKMKAVLFWFSFFICLAKCVILFQVLILIALLLLNTCCKMKYLDNSDENVIFQSSAENSKVNCNNLNHSSDLTSRPVAESTLKSVDNFPIVTVKRLKLKENNFDKDQEVKTCSTSENNSNIEITNKVSSNQLSSLKDESSDKSKRGPLEADQLIEENAVIASGNQEPAAELRAESILREVQSNSQKDHSDEKIKEERLEAGETVKENTEAESENQELTSEMLTESILKEEQCLQDDGEKETENLKQLAIEKFREISMNARLSQLNHLLEKSSIYANYLLDIIDARKKSEEKKALRKEKRKKSNSKVKKAGAAETKIAYNGDKRFSKKRKQDGDRSAAKKRKGDDVDRANDAAFDRGDLVCIIKALEDGEEELLSGKVVDSCCVDGTWKYQIKPKKQKSKKEWVAECNLVVDVSDPEENGVNKSSVILASAIQRIDKNALFNAKFYEGAGVSANFSLDDEERYFNGQIIPAAQPEYLSGGILRNYQVTGFQWLKVLFDNAVNGILADEMGLGKTIQCIAMICRLIKTGFRGPFLVCAPLSTVCNWISEFKKFAPQIPVLLYHGSAAERYVLRTVIGKTFSSLNCSPVVVTSYEVFMRDRPPLSKHSWDYLIVDEGHRLKNINCRLLRELKALNVTAKVLLTGTPLQNSLAELWSLLNFLLPEVFNDLNTFEAWFDLGEIQKRAKAISSEKEEQIIVMLHKILAPFLLRRTKSDIDIELPPKRELLLFVPLSSSQAMLYQAIADRTIRKLFKKDVENKVDLTIFNDFSDSAAENSPMKSLTRSSTLNYRMSMEKRSVIADEDDSVVNVSLNNLMMQMRKCCNHPYLIKYPLIPGTDIFRIDEELITSCGKLQLLDKMLPVLRKNGHKILMFSQMTKILDILQDFCEFRNFPYFRLDGSTKCEDRQQYIDQFNNSSESFLFLLSTRAGGLGINLTAADTVIIYDSDWNPQNDLQAQDRCHRIGQTRPVIVYRFVAANTVDQFMVERAEAKRVLERLVINQSKFKGKLDEDMKSNSSNSVESTTLLSMLEKFGTDSIALGQINEAELKKILDRKEVMTCSDSDLSCGVFQNIQ